VSGSSWMKALLPLVPLPLALVPQLVLVLLVLVS
jgi:hypothetical protein